MVPLEIHPPPIKNPLEAWIRAREWILDIEGGYVDDPHDPGGKTNFGISQRTYQNIDVEHLTRDAAAVLYKRDFWDRICAGELPAALGIALFDAAVNQGPNRAVMLLQITLGVHADGVVGPDTLSRARSTTRLQAEMLTDYLSRRAVHYVDLSNQRIELRKFLRGWLKRLFELEAVCLSEVA